VISPHTQELDWLTAAALGAIQGIAEFLPISSSGHLSLAQSWLGLDPAIAGHRFNIVLHAGTLAAVLWVFRSDLFELIRSLFQPVDRGPHVRPARRTFSALVLATLPLGLVLVPGVEDLLVAMESRPRWVGVALLVTAAVLFFSHRKQPPNDLRSSPPSLLHSVLIGVAQMISVAPGISRSGSTIAAGLALGMGRARAARFSFLLSIPAIGGASAKELLSIISDEGSAPVDTGVFAIGFFVSLGTGLFALRSLLKLIERVGMLPFVPYLIAVGLTSILLS